VEHEQLRRLAARTARKAKSCRASLGEAVRFGPARQQHLLSDVKPLVAARELVKSYRKGAYYLVLMASIWRSGTGVRRVVGQSGSGKSTLLHLLGTLDAPDSGESGSRQSHRQSAVAAAISCGIAISA